MARLVVLVGPNIDVEIGDSLAHRDPALIRSLLPLVDFSNRRYLRLRAAGAYVAPDKEIVALIAYLQQLGKFESVGTPAAKTAPGQ